MATRAMQPAGPAAESSAGPDGRMSAREYNYEHFWPAQLLTEACRMLAASGVRPGEVVPDFELPMSGGGSLRLSELRGRPVLLHFASYT